MRGLGPDLEEPLVLGDDELDHPTQAVAHRHVHGVVDSLTLPQLGTRNVIRIHFGLPKNIRFNLYNPIKN